MTKKVSAILFVSMLLFVVSAFATSTIHSHELNTDIFGYPFVFFKSNATASETSFSLLGLLGNIATYATIAYGIVTTIIKLQDFGDRNNNFKSYP